MTHAGDAQDENRSSDAAEPAAPGTGAAGENTTAKLAYQRNIDELLPSDLLAEDEIVIFAIKPSLWTVAFLSFRVVVIAAVVAAAVLMVGQRLQLGQLGRIIIAGCGAVALGRLGFALLQWLSRSYVLTDKRVIRIRGVFTIDIFQCSLAKVQNTFLVLTLPQRILNLGNIELTTAGTGHVEAIWRHCKEPLKVHQQLLQALNRASNQPLPKDSAV